MNFILAFGYFYINGRPFCRSSQQVHLTHNAFSDIIIRQVHLTHNAFSDIIIRH